MGLGIRIYKRPVGLTKEINFRFLDRGMEGVYLGRTYHYLPHPISHFVGTEAQPGRNLGRLL